MRHLLAATCLFLMATSASAQTDIGAITRGMIEGHILPGYASLVGAAATQERAVLALCEDPSETMLATAQSRFGEMVEVWSAVEFIRFGPARQDNRYERLFFWPDRNGRGLNQVQGVLATQDESVTSVQSLQGKSVALQGMLALDYALFGTGFEALAVGDAHRCAYALAVSGAIADTAEQMLDSWTGRDGYAALMLSPGPDNAVYRSEGEALQELLRAMAEQLQIVHDAKIMRVAGNDTSEARPRRAPFWRSGQALANIIANGQAMLSLNEAGGFAEHLPEQARRYAGTARFELGQIVSRLSALDETGHDFESIVTGEDTHGRFVSTALSLAGAMRIVGEVYPSELGLTMGFNSLDGD